MLGDHDSHLAVSYGQVASLVFLLYEHFLTFDDEVGVIWSKGRHAWIKWVFLFVRYFALSIQLVNRTLEFCISMRSPIVADLLERWYMSQVGVGCVLMILVEVVLMARVYAMYEKRDVIRLVFLLLIVIEVASLFAGVFLTFPRDPFNLEIYISKNSRAYAYFGVAAILSQVAILILTLKKYRHAIYLGRGNEPIMVLVIRDGILSFSALLGVTVLTVVATATQNEYATIANSWFVSVVACAGCRLIINLQRFSEIPTDESRSTDFSTTVQLTTLRLSDFESAEQFEIPGHK